MQTVTKPNFKFAKVVNKALTEVATFILEVFSTVWVLVWLWYLVLSVLVYTYLRNIDINFAATEIRYYLSTRPDIELIWLYCGLFLFINYTTAFILKRFYFRIGSLFFITSLFVLFCLSVLVYPHISLLLDQLSRFST